MDEKKSDKLNINLPRIHSEKSSERKRNYLYYFFN